MEDIGDASVEHVRRCMENDFSNIFAVNPRGEQEFDPTHLLMDLQWYEADCGTEVYPLLLCEPILEDIPNNLVCLCPPFNKEKHS